MGEIKAVYAVRTADQDRFVFKIQVSKTTNSLSHLQGVIALFQKASGYSKLQTSYHKNLANASFIICHTSTTSEVVLTKKGLPRFGVVPFLI